MKRRPHLGMHRLLVNANSQSADKAARFSTQAPRPCSPGSYTATASEQQLTMHHTCM